MTSATEDYECANCTRKYTLNDLAPIHRYWERVDADDDTVPAGECPDCGALCY